ncbi:MAG: GDP-mannose 4,6-dehydratase [Gemmatimonadetes bacterium]|jgi:UDP-glucose 4-epimerase|nr:GDP-mannose 4,6-dehydratase [Gemmatimonadota bacterium]MCC7323923.1 GDP-mannose 4,6-dehydratase [Gemmatimonadaceae bacterium]MBK6455603.1 GDP-mannose 4,6-dehydratase [Gemmatimonadota bacterium]MBK6841776.1 GDP-mannose 4,6-dehydratase [Gemmatimonadota bacterium]MBK7835478.1 GDP-mannose 4,6-dehydratase [Gemmatimonadota bacterium]
MSRRALVSGGAGFIGSHVTELLLSRGYHVDIVDNLSSGKRENVPAGATLHVADIGSADAAALVRGGRYDVLCHLAAQIDVRKSVNDPMYDAGVNIVGTLNLLEAVRTSGHQTRVIFSSTGGAIYGDFVSVPTVESMPKDPQSPYGIAKLSVEYYMGYYARIHGLDTVALRYANVYGPRQDPHGEAGVVAIFCNRILKGEALTVFGEGLQTRDYVYAGDVARANLAAAEATLPAAAQVDVRAYNVGTGVETTVLDLAAALQGAAGSNVPVQHAPARLGEQQRSSVNIDKAARELGWRPEMTLAEGTRRTFEYFAAKARGGAA